MGKIKGNKRNVRRILNLADETDINEGRVSYFRYHEVLRNLAAFYSVPFGPVVAVFCALSPNNDYRGNLRSAATVIKGFVEGVPVDHIKVTTYNHCRDRAFRYLDGSEQFETPARGKKILSFYRNCFNPMEARPVTIDGHAVNVWRNKKTNLKAIVGGFNYETVANDYREVAAESGLLPNQLQAITWFAWKRIHNIVYAGRQLELFRDVSSDLWRTLVDPATIKTFEFTPEPNPTKWKPTQTKEQLNLYGRQNREKETDNLPENPQGLRDADEMQISLPTTRRRTGQNAGK